MDRVTPADLLSHYFGITSLPVLISSPLREDSHPSFFIYSPDGVKVLYKDYAKGDDGDIYSLIQQVKNWSFAELMREISKEEAFNKKSNKLHNTASQGKPFKTRTPSTLKVKVRNWEPYDIEYWQSYGISTQWLEFADVHPISHKIIYKDGERYVFRAAKLAYVFVERKEGNISLKVYQPMNKLYKWTTSNDGSVVGLWTKVPQKGDKLVICSSLKDALCLWANTGIPAIYVQSETVSMSLTAQEVLKQRYKEVYICFDNDEPGIEDGIKFANQTGFKNVVLPQFEGGKDISDLYKTVGKEEFIKIVKPLFS